MGITYILASVHLQPDKISHSIGLAHKLRTPNEGLTQQNPKRFGPKLALCPTFFPQCSIIVHVSLWPTSWKTKQYYLRKWFAKHGQEWPPQTLIVSCGRSTNVCHGWPKQFRFDWFKPSFGVRSLWLTSWGNASCLVISHSLSTTQLVSRRDFKFLSD